MLPARGVQDGDSVADAVDEGDVEGDGLGVEVADGHGTASTLS
jgi:hypothetical protein